MFKYIDKNVRKTDFVHFWGHYHTEEAAAAKNFAARSADYQQERMAETGIRNMGAYVRKMALNGYVLQVNLAPVRELISLQRRCANNLNQVAIHANTYGRVPTRRWRRYKRDHPLWEPLSDLLEKLAEVVAM